MKRLAPLLLLAAAVATAEPLTYRLDPEASFVHFEVLHFGTSTLRGRAAPLTLTATRFNCYFNPLFLREVCGGDFEARFKPADWGLGGAAALGLPDEWRLAVQIEAIKQ